MTPPEQYIWIIPVLPLVAAGITALARRRDKVLSASLAIGSMALAFIGSVAVMIASLRHPGELRVWNFNWFQTGNEWFRIGWLLDPLTVVMLVMVCFVGLLIFIYSAGYMWSDRNCGRFFCFLSLFAAAMLGLIISNNLLVFFMCWELVGLASYLLIGFWFDKPAASAAAKKAFVTTRIGDIAFLLGMAWLYSETGTLLLYDDGAGCLESTAISKLTVQTSVFGMAVSTAISLMIFAGAVGKSGQVPLHVWLPDAMEGPTPVSALIHAATMVAAGVFLIARLYPLISAPAPELLTATPLKVIAWVGAITAIFAALTAVAQFDLKRILAYSTVSQLGFMMLGLATGGVAVGMFHLITHAFFKALLFLGAGSVIHGAHGAQDIRDLGGLRKWMPITFATYAIGMMALAGVPVFFSGFWSKDAILHSAGHWPVSAIPFYLALISVFLTAFYMTRQMAYVFFGEKRAQESGHPGEHAEGTVHESPAVMTVPLVMLAACALLLSLIGTPAWPWFESFLDRAVAEFDLSRLMKPASLKLMACSFMLMGGGVLLGWLLYGRKAIPRKHDPLEALRPDIWSVLNAKFYFDEIYQATVIPFTGWLSRATVWLDRQLWDGLVRAATMLVLGLAWISRLIDERGINVSFDRSCRELLRGGGRFARLQTGQGQFYLRCIGLGAILLMILLAWEWRRL